MAGRFITFEGGEGSGKSTQLRLLQKYLESRGIDVVPTKEPGGTEVGLDLRHILVTGDKDKMDPVAEALLYYADRRIHLTKKVWPAMARGCWVLSDRFADSTMAYQYYGYNKRLEKETLDNLYQLAVGNFAPDLTVIFDIDVETGLARSYAKSQGMPEKELRHESRGTEFHNNLRRGFLEIAEQNSGRCVVLNADKSVDELHKDVVAVINKRFGLS